MKFAFFGTPRFAAIILEELLNQGLVPAALICNPDRPAGRKKVITPPKTKMIAADWNKDVEIFQPEELNEDFANKLRSLNCDFFLVAAFGRIIPENILDIPRLGVLGIHPSLLPKFRGASPIQSAILSDDEKTGVTIYKMDDKMDHGPIVVQTETEVGLSCYCHLEEKLAKMGAKLFAEIVLDFLAEKTVLQEQDESKATYTKKFVTDDGFVDLEKIDPVQALKKICAFNPEPGAWTLKDGKRMKILEADIRDNKLILKKTQMEGGKPVEMEC